MVNSWKFVLKYIAAKQIIFVRSAHLMTNNSTKSRTNSPNSP